MSNQLHGKKFEDILKPCFPGACDHERDIHSAWDIEKEFDREDRLPTSIKAKKTDANIVEMADARKFFSIDETFRLLITRYNQIANRKVFWCIEEFIINKEQLSILKGDLTYENINYFHNQLLTYGNGKHKEGRIWAKTYKKILPYNEYVILNPKIDSKLQRRLQCSLKIDKLKNIITPIIYEEEYRELCLPISIISEKRKFNKK